MSKTAIIIGAGPAGLTAAYELLTKTDIKPIIIEKTEHIGGISKTINYKGNRIDIGGHRFFSKSDRVMNWWLNILPLEKKQPETPPAGFFIPTQKESSSDKVMLNRKRKSRIYFAKHFFDYPITLSIQTFRKFGLIRAFKIGSSYIKSSLFPIKKEASLEDFMINRFGKELYTSFFKPYTEKVWGIPCNQLGKEWGSQRMKGLTLRKTIAHALKQVVSRKTKSNTTETSLIEEFLYPKYGAGQMWEEVAQQIENLGGTIIRNLKVNNLYVKENVIQKIEATHSKDNTTTIFEGDYFFSTMPIKHLIIAMQETVPAAVKEISDGLMYRDIIVVGLLLNKLNIYDNAQFKNSLTKDTWIYFQENDVLVCRMEIFNNWSPYIVADPTKVWIGVEYFCNQKSAFWEQTDNEIIQLAKAELKKHNFIHESDVLDATVVRQKKAYPIYFGTYDQFDRVKDYLDQFKNLFLIGRNGMHRYNNMDHSMLSAMIAVENIINKIEYKQNIWTINTEKEYHETK